MRRPLLPRTRRPVVVLTPMLTCLSVFALAIAPVRPSSARSGGDRIIRLMDEAMTRAEDQRFSFELITQEPGKEPRSMLLDVAIKGTEWRWVKFLAPGDLKGMKVLVRSLQQMYIYLPAYRKIRRVASHVRDQGFMGTTFSHDDISTVTYGNLFAGKLLKETKTHWTVLGTLRPDKKYPYAKIEFVINMDIRQPESLRYFNDKGVNVKTETRSDYECRGKICTPRSLKLIDHTRNGAWSRFSLKKWQVNTGLSDRFFSVRALQR